MRSYYVLSLASLILTSCLGYKEMPVEYDYSYKGNFKKYKTFDLMDLSYVDSSATNRMIEKSILSRMQFLGYKQTDHKPHLLVSYKMFNDSLMFHGYVQPEIEHWMTTRDETLNYDPKKLNLHTGTLLIQLFDKRQNRSIWQGYSTSLYGSIDFNDPRNVRNAVISILDKYRIWAEGFIEGNAYRESQINN